MIDMKLSHEQTSMLGTEPTENNGPSYPHGLTISLDAESLRKLAMSLPQVGDQMMLHAQVEVIAVSKDTNQIEDGKRVELQIQTMELVAEDDVRNEQQRAYDKITRMY